MYKCTYCGESSIFETIYVAGYHVPTSHHSCICEIEEEREFVSLVEVGEND
ncbi:hypothetical protein D3C74_479900 [compost metagenome]